MKCPYCTMPLDGLTADGLYRASFNYNGREFSTIDSLEGVKDWMARFIRLLMPEHVNAATRFELHPTGKWPL